MSKDQEKAESTKKSPKVFTAQQIATQVGIEASLHWWLGRKYPTSDRRTGAEWCEEFVKEQILESEKVPNHYRSNKKTK